MTDIMQLYHDFVEMNIDDKDSMLYLKKINSNMQKISQSWVYSLLKDKYRREPPIQFDRNENLFGFVDRVLDLSTNEFRMYDPVDYMTITT